MMAFDFFDSIAIHILKIMVVLYIVWRRFYGEGAGR